MDDIIDEMEKSPQSILGKYGKYITDEKLLKQLSREAESDYGGESSQ